MPTKFGKNQVFEFLVFRDAETATMSLIFSASRRRALFCLTPAGW